MRTQRERSCTLGIDAGAADIALTFGIIGSRGAGLNLSAMVLATQAEEFMTTPLTRVQDPVNVSLDPSTEEVHMKRVFLVALVGAALLIPSGAGAHVASKKDPNEVSGRLDIRRFGMEHWDKILVGIKFDQPVNKGDFAQGNHAGLNLETSGDAVPDRTVEIKRKNGKLKCTMFNTRNDRRLGAVRARRVGARVACRMPNRLLSQPPNALNAFSSYDDAEDFTGILEH